MEDKEIYPDGCECFDNKSVYIYGLVDPESLAIRYIGKTTRPERRLQEHTTHTTLKSRCHRTSWIKSVIKKGLPIHMICLMELHGAAAYDWRYWEKYFISYARENGWPLVNDRDGGDGVPENLSKESIEKRNSTWIGRKHKPESLIKIGNASRGRRHTEENKRRMSEMMKGREILWADKVAESVRKLTPEDVEIIKIRLANGEKNCDLAKEYGVHRTTLSKVKMGAYFDRYRS